MKIKGKLKEMLELGEGHQIYKSEDVMKALTKAGFVLSVRNKNGVTVGLNGKQDRMVFYGAPKQKPQSKYDIAVWKGSKKDLGVHDLNLIEVIVNLSEREYDGGRCIGRGFQYKAYFSWLERNGYIGG